MVVGARSGRLRTNQKAVMRLGHRTPPAAERHARRTADMENGGILLTIAEVAVAFAGFASIVSVLGRRSSDTPEHINALRMRPDRIVVGEVRGGEALDMLQAMNTGHDGSLTTVHANAPRDALSRIETMISMSDVSLPDKATPDIQAYEDGMETVAARRCSFIFGNATTPGR